MTKTVCTCDICDNTPVASGKDAIGRVYRACAEHRPFLAGRINESNREMECDSIASLRYEDAR